VKLKAYTLKERRKLKEEQIRLSIEKTKVEIKAKVYKKVPAANLVTELQTIEPLPGPPSSDS